MFNLLDNVAGQMLREDEKEKPVRDSNVSYIFYSRTAKNADTKWTDNID